MENLGEEKQSMDARLYQLVANGEVSVLSGSEGLDLKSLNAVTNNTIIHVAARYGQVNFIAEALKRVPDFVNQKNADDDTPLHLAAAHGHRGAAKLLVACALRQEAVTGLDPAYVARNKAGDTPLHVALRNGHLSVADHILTADPYGLRSLVNSSSGETPLHLVVRYCSGFLKSTSLVRTDKKGTVNEEGFLTSSESLDQHMLKSENLCSLRSKRTVLFDRAICHFTEGLDNACLRDKKGLTPLHIAADVGSFRALLLILSYCPQATEVYDHTSRTVLHYLKLSDYQELGNLLDRPEINALKNVKDCDGNTPAHLAANNGNFKLVKVLYEASADFFLRNNAGVMVEDLLEPTKRSFPSQSEGGPITGAAEGGLNTGGSDSWRASQEINERTIMLNKKNVKEITQIQKLMDKDLYTKMVNEGKIRLDETAVDIESGAIQHEDFLTRTCNESNIIHIALRHGNDEAVPFIEKALKRFPSLILERDSNGDTPLHLASKWDTHVSHKLMEYVAEDYKKSLKESIGRCDLASLCCCRSLFLSPWKMKNSEGNMAIHEALRHNNFIAAQMMFDADPDAAFHVNDADETPLHVFARCAFYSKSRWRTEINEDEDEDEDEDIELCFLEKLILKNICAVCMRDRNGLTPLMIAAKYGRVIVVLALLEHCPQSAELQDLNGRTFLHLMHFEAYEFAGGSGGNLFKRMGGRLFQIAEADAARKVKDYDGNSPLHYALKNSNSILAKVLLWRSFQEDRRFEYEAPDNDSNTIQDLMETDGLSNEVLELYQKEHPGTHFWCFKSSYGIRKEQIKESVTTLSVIAALLTTLSFAAAFQVPGGLDGNNGSPLLLSKLAFKVFLITDAFAICSSTVVLFSLIWVLGSARFRDSLLLIDIAICLLQSSFYATLVAFMTGVYVTAAHKNLWLAISICVACSIVIFITWNSFFLFIIKKIAVMKLRLCNRWEHFVNLFHRE